MEVMDGLSWRCVVFSWKFQIDFHGSESLYHFYERKVTSIEVHMPWFPWFVSVAIPAGHWLNEPSLPLRIAEGPCTNIFISDDDRPVGNKRERQAYI